MPLQRVDDLDDPRLAPFAQLHQRRSSATIVVEGEIAVARALAGSHPVDCVLTTKTHRERLGDAIGPEVMVLEADAALIREVVGFDFHRGCVAVMDRPRGPERGELIERLGRGSGLAGADVPGSVVAVVAEGLADPVNLGAIIRNARAFGVPAVLHGSGADPWSRRAIRASMGLGFEMSVVDCDDLVGVVEELRRGLGDVRVVAAVVQPGAISLREYRPGERTIVLVGNEGTGLSDALRQCADDAVTIPLAAGVDSLNAAAATAVLLWSLSSAPR